MHFPVSYKSICGLFVVISSVFLLILFLISKEMKTLLYLCAFRELSFVIQGHSIEVVRNNVRKRGDTQHNRIV